MCVGCHCSREWGKQKDSGRTRERLRDVEKENQGWSKKPELVENILVSSAEGRHGRQHHTQGTSSQAVCCILGAR